MWYGLVLIERRFPFEAGPGQDKGLTLLNVLSRFELFGEFREDREEVREGVGRVCSDGLFGEGLCIYSVGVRCERTRSDHKRYRKRELPEAQVMVLTTLTRADERLEIVDDRDAGQDPVVLFPLPRGTPTGGKVLPDGGQLGGEVFVEREGWLGHGCWICISMMRGSKLETR